MKWEKIGRKIKGYIYKIATTPAANYLILQDLVPNKSWDKAIWLKWLNIRITSFKYSWILM